MERTGKAHLSTRADAEYQRHQGKVTHHAIQMNNAFEITMDWLVAWSFQMPSLDMCSSH